MSARLNPFPAATSTAPAAPVTVTGTREGVRLPVPSSPVVLSPQDQTVVAPIPDAGAVTAREWVYPAATVVALARPGMMTGFLRVVVVPSPIWPLALEPQAMT